MPQHRREVYTQRRTQVAELYVKGHPQAEIGQRLGVTQQQISSDIKAIQQQWLASTLRDFDAVKSEQLAKVDQIEREAWDAWSRSCQPREVTVQEATEGETRTKKVTLRKEQQVGDPRFLQIIQKAIDQRCDILGIGQATEAAKALGTGLAALLTQAQSAVPLSGQILVSTPISPPLPEA
jgi:hypothetical protein